jgi:colicin import membrane protein
MNETEIAAGIATGALDSPQKFGESFLIAIRITGTGLSTRPSIGESVWRDPSAWLSEDAQARCNGLSVTLDHPETDVLTADEYAKRSVGSIIFPYVADRAGIQDQAGPDLWGIARLFLDADMIGAIAEQSTSPGVSFTKLDGNRRITLDDGTECLVEASPTNIDHLAIVLSGDGAGVWDQGSKAERGIRFENKENTQMTEEEMAAEKARKDAEEAAGGNIDRVLKHLDAISKRLDSLEAKGPGDQPGKIADTAKARRDSERQAWARDDGAQCLQDDAEEETEAAELESRGAPKEVAADMARKSRKDRMVARADNSLSRQQKDAVESAAIADAWARSDAVARLFGKQAPMAMQGEKVIPYRKRLLRQFQRFSTFKDADLNTISKDAATFVNVENIIYADAVKASATPEVPDGEFLKRTRTDESGHKITEFFGNRTIFSKFSQPAMRATAWHTPRQRAG